MRHSFIFAQKDGEPLLIECGEALGDITSRLKENKYISEFISDCPKNYVILLRGGEDTFKVLGITFNYKDSKLVNFHAIKNMVLNGRPPLTVHTDKKSNVKRASARECVDNHGS